MRATTVTAEDEQNIRTAETQLQPARLQSMGCEAVQGYLHAEPMPAHEVAGWVAARA